MNKLIFVCCLDEFGRFASQIQERMKRLLSMYISSFVIFKVQFQKVLGIKIVKIFFESKLNVELSKV